MTHNLIFVLYVMLVVQGCTTSIPISQRSELNHDQERFSQRKEVGKQEAIAAAREAAQQDRDELDSSEVTACETGLFWRIIYEKAGSEYVINKRSGKVIGARQLLHNYSATSAELAFQGDLNRNIGEQKAIEIAMQDTIQSIPGEDPNRFVAFACELSEAWRVSVEFKLISGLNGEPAVIPFASTPNYVIDKRSGQILSKARD